MGAKVRRPLFETAGYPTQEDSCILIAFPGNHLGGLLAVRRAGLTRASENMRPGFVASARRGEPSAVRRLILLGAGAAYLASLGVFAYAARGAGHFPGELTVTLWVQSWRAPWLDTLMTAVSAPGFRNIALPVVGLTTALLFIRGERRASLVIWAAVVATALFSHTVNRMVARPRPADDLVHIFRDLDGFSFPSGHVTHYCRTSAIMGHIESEENPRV